MKNKHYFPIVQHAGGAPLLRPGGVLHRENLSPYDTRVNNHFLFLYSQGDESLKLLRKCVRGNLFFSLQEGGY